MMKNQSLNFVAVWSYDNYVPAHIALGRLKEDGFDCWLKDENTVTMNPIWTNAVGGIKLMVEVSQSQAAFDLLKDLQLQYKSTITCPNCSSHNTEFVSTPRKASNWLSFLLGVFSFGFAMPVDQVNHCFDCGHEFLES